MARQSRCFASALDGEIVFLWLAEQGLINRSAKRRFRSITFSQRASQIDMIILSKAHIDAACAGDPNPVAARTKIVRQRRYKAKLSASFFNADIS